MLITSIKLPHLSGTARGAIKNQFKILDKIGGATADNIAEVYAKEIIFHIELLKCCDKSRLIAAKVHQFSDCTKTFRQKAKTIGKEDKRE